MPSVINPRSGPFPIYSSTSPPSIDVGIFTVSKTGLDLKTAGTNNIFTVPSGRVFVALFISARVTAVNTAGAGILVNFQTIESGASASMTTAQSSVSHTPAVGTYYVGGQGVTNVTTFSASTSCVAGNIVQEKHTTSHAGSTGVTGTAYVTGFYTQ